MRNARSSGFSQSLTWIRFGGVVERCQFGEVQAVRGGERVQPGQNFGDLADGRVLVAVVGDRVPEGHHLLIDDDRLVDVDHADRRIVDGLQPPGDRDGPATWSGAPRRDTRATTGASGDRRRWSRPVAGARRGRRARRWRRPARGRPGVVHPRADQGVPADMRSR